MKRKDLATALRFLKSIENENPVELFDDGSPVADPIRSRFRELELFGPQRDWEVLDTCLNANNMKLVGNAYKFLKDRGFLPNFGKCRNIGEFCNLFYFSESCLFLLQYFTLLSVIYEF